MKTYYEMSKYDNGQFTENQKRQCAAGEETQAINQQCPSTMHFVIVIQGLMKLTYNTITISFCCTRRLQNLANKTVRLLGGKDPYSSLRRSNIL